MTHTVGGHLLPLLDCVAEPPARVGRKASVLAWAQAHGMATPGGLVLTSARFWQVLEASGLREQARYLEDAALRLDPVHTVDMAAALHAALGASAVADMALADARRAFAALGVDRLVCRSSSALEDGRNAAFAGVFVSVLDLTTIEALAQAIVTCWRSAFAPTAIQYLLRMRTEPIDFSLAVLIQPQIPADWYGLYVSADPLSGRREPQIELSNGGPDALVNGAPATLTARRVRGAWTGPAADLGALEPAMEWVFEAARRLSEHLGSEVDVEFALPPVGEPVLLQGRPLTRSPATARAVAAPPALGARILGRRCAPGSALGYVAATGERAAVGGPRVAVVETLTPADYGIVFRHAAIVMTEDTSPLGHVAILCRELGVPLVCGVGAAAAELNGRWVVVDGDVGTVQAVEPPRQAHLSPARASDAGPLVMTDLELRLRLLAEGRGSAEPIAEGDDLLRKVARRLGAPRSELMSVPLADAGRASLDVLTAASRRSGRDSP
jgi:pyruvate,water dikinase